MANKISTYWPKNGAVYHGDQSQIDLRTYSPDHAKIGSIIQDKTTKKYSAKINPKLHRALAASKQYKAALNESSIDHINEFTLSRELVGTPDEWYAIEAATRPINVASLTMRIPERDAFKSQIGVKPLQEVDFTQVKYGEDHFDLTYNGAPFFHPTEDILKGVINPMNVDLTETQRALREAREGLALLELTKGTAGTGLSDMESTTSGKHNNNPRREIVGKIRSHFKSTQARVNWSIWNPVDLQRYESNDAVKGFEPGREANLDGTLPLRGIPGVMAAVSALVPLGTVYFVSNQGFLRGEGPKQTEQWRRPENNAELGIARDYVQFLLMNPSRFAFKEAITLTSSGDTAETEPSTIEDIRALVSNPSVAVNAPTIG